MEVKSGAFFTEESMRRIMILAAAAALFVPAAASAQTRIGVYYGVGSYDLAGVDEPSVFSLRASRSLVPLLAVEASVTGTRLEQDYNAPDERTTFVMPELQLQLQLPLGLFAPYIGAGAGLSLARADAASDEDVTFNAGAGIRLDLPMGLGFGVDGRARTFGTGFTASGADLSFGVTYRF
jgi:hypothetical protein